MNFVLVLAKNMFEHLNMKIYHIQNVRTEYYTLKMLHFDNFRPKNVTL